MVEKITWKKEHPASLSDPGKGRRGQLGMSCLGAMMTAVILQHLDGRSQIKAKANLAGTPSKFRKPMNFTMRVAGQSVRFGDPHSQSLMIVHEICVSKWHQIVVEKDGT
jgi:hypothetical protein